MKSVRFYLLALYSVALVSSMAAMEILAWVLVTFMLTEFVLETAKRGIKDVMAQIQRNLRTGADVYILGFVVVGALSLLFSPVPETSFKPLGTLRWPLVLYALILAWSQLQVGQKKQILGLLASCLTLVAIYSIFQLFTGRDLVRSIETMAPMPSGLHRAVGFFSMSLTFAYVMGTLGFSLSGHLVNKKFINFDKLDWLYGLGFVSGIVGCLTSQTRGSWLGILAAAGLTLLLFNRKRFKVAGLVAAPLLATLVLASPGFKSRILSIFDKANTSNYHRTMIWQGNWGIVKAHPWLGVGYSRNSEWVADYFEKENGLLPDSEGAQLEYNKASIVREQVNSHAHNNVLQFLAGTGIFGALFYLLFSVVFLRLGFILATSQDSFAKVIGLGVFAAQIYWQVGGFTECNFIDGEVNHAIMFTWALAVSEAKRIKLI